MDLSGVRTENLARLSAIISELSRNGRRNRFNEIDDLVSVSVKGLSLDGGCKSEEKKQKSGNKDGTKHVSITGTIMIEEENNKDDAKTNVLKKGKTIQIAYFGAVDKLNDADKEMILEFVYRWKLEHAFKNVDKNIEVIKRFI